MSQKTGHFHLALTNVHFPAFSCLTLRSLLCQHATMRIALPRSALFIMAVFMLRVPEPAAAQISLVNPFSSGLPNAWDITAGPDGAMWFTACIQPSCATFAVGRMTLVGDITQYPTPNLAPYGIATGPDGALWFTDWLSNSIGRLCASTSPTCPSVGYISDYPVTTANSFPIAIRSGADGAMWFIEQSANQIGRICVTTASANCPFAGSVTEYPIPTPASGAQRITAGPDGAMWFTEADAGNIARVCTSISPPSCPAIGHMNEYPTPTPYSSPTDITTGPDGALWFVEGIGQVGRITTGGQISEYPANRGYDDLIRITSGPDGTLWFLSIYDGYYPALGQITTSGAFPTYYDIGYWLNVLTSGPDGSVWIGTWYSGPVLQVQPAARRNGIDLSAASPVPSADTLRQFQEAGVRYAVVEGCTQSVCSNPVSLLNAFSKAGIKTAAYCYLYFSQSKCQGLSQIESCGSQQAQNCFDSISGALSKPGFVAIDVEDTTTPLVTDPVSLISDAIHTLHNNGVTKVAIYTDQSYWSTLTNNTKQFSSYSFWNAGHGHFTAYSDPAGNLRCTSKMPAAIKSLTPTLHGGTGIASLTAPANITAFLIGNNVVTLVAANTFMAGQVVTISGLTTGTYLNGKRLTVLASQLSTTQFAANFSHSDVPYTYDTGTASLVLFGGWMQQAGTQFDIGTSGACLFGTNVDFDVFDPSLFGPDFTLGASPSSFLLTQGTQATATLTLAPIAGFNTTVALSCSGFPSGSSCSVSPTSVNVGGANPTTATITVQTTASTPTGNYTLKLTGTSSIVTRNSFVGLTVQ